MARLIFHHVGTLHFEDHHTKKKHRNHEDNKKKLKKKHQKITLSSRLARELTQATQHTCNQHDFKID